MLNSYLGFINFSAKEGGGITLEWDELSNIASKVMSIIFILVLMYLGIKIGNKIIDKFMENQIRSKLSFSMNQQKATTIGAVLKSVLKYTAYFSAVGLIVVEVFSGISAAVLGAGGFVIGIGAQSLVKDLINGFFILFEDQFGLGDHITVGQYTGIVENIGIRTTVLRDFTGDLHLIANGSILEVTNHSRGNIRFLVDVEIAYEEDVEKVIKIIEKTCREFKNKNNDDIPEDIEVLGVTSLNASGITIRVVGRAKPLTQWKMERDLRKTIKEVLDENKVEIPYPKTQLIK